MGGLRLGMEMIKGFFPKGKITSSSTFITILGTPLYTSNPTWGPHRRMPLTMGIPNPEYRYYDEKNITVDFKGMCEDLSNAPKGSCILI